MTDEDRAKLKNVASQFHTRTIKVVRASVGEDDFPGILTFAFEALNKIYLCHRVKADWREELKPTNWQEDHDLDVFVLQPDKALPPSKRQPRSTDQVFSSPLPTIDEITPASAKEPQEATPMPPPVARPSAPKGDRSVIKTPRPDLSIGISSSVLISRLSTDIYNGYQVKKLLKTLQNTMESPGAGKPPEPVLMSEPTLRASDLAFPFLVVEGKAYSTGKQMFEAENQVAVAGACGLKIQPCLDNFVRKVNRTISTTSDISLTPSTLPLFFSVYTEGPIHTI